MKLKKAMRKYPIRQVVKGDIFDHDLFNIGEKRIWFSQKEQNWKGSLSDNDSYHYFNTEKQAVAWLVEGAERRVNLPKKPVWLSGPDHVRIEVFLSKEIPAITWHNCPVCGKWHRLTS